MPYISPSGWFESRPPAEHSIAVVIFHCEPDCATIDPGNSLERAERPFGARRCTVCAAR
jgi:hypothetical protein